MNARMDEKVFFVVGPPRSGSTLLARMLGAHSKIYSRPEPHLLTPLAHLGFYDKVDKAPYDAVLAAESAREFVAASREFDAPEAGPKIALPSGRYEITCKHEKTRDGVAFAPKQSNDSSLVRWETRPAPGIWKGALEARGLVLDVGRSIDPSLSSSLPDLLEAGAAAPAE